MPPQAAGVRLADLQRPVAPLLGAVADELRRLIAADFPLIAEVNGHLLQMKGKLFRPMLMFLSNRAARAEDARLLRFAAIIELTHLATLVHDAPSVLPVIDVVSRKVAPCA